MIPRGVLDISWASLFLAAGSAFVRRRSESDGADLVAKIWDAQRQVVTCLSVRSGLDLLLEVLAWPAGSEILVSAVTIPHIAEIVRAHGLVPVPIDVEAGSLAPDVEQLTARIGPRTRAILVAHLFGSRLDLEPLARVAAANKLQLWEDLAQGFAADGHSGSEHADASFFSFGLIKSQTALGGAVLRLRDEELAARCRAEQAEWPVQPARSFRRKVFRALMLRALGQRAVFTGVQGLAACGGIDLDSRLCQAARGFSATNWLAQLRYQPCAAQVELLRRRLAEPDRRWLSQRTALAEVYRRELPPHVLCGREAAFPTHWVLPIRSRNPQQLCQRLRQQGFDATQRGSQLAVISPPPEHPEWHTPQASAWLPQLVFLPLHPALTPAHIARLATLVAEEEDKR